MLKFTEFGRRMAGKGFQQIFKLNPNLIYHKKIHESQEVALPIPSKVIGGALVLQGYTLDSGHCMALASTIKKSQRPKINAVYLDNCGVDDHELSLLLDGLLHMEGFQKFVYKNNVFLEESLEMLKPILKLKSPRDLQELRLVNLQTKPEVIRELLDHMTQCRVELRTLGLVQLHIDQLAIHTVARFVEESNFLEDLDLSWNDLIPSNFVPLLDVLSRNKMLKSLNLSWNMIIDKAAQNNPISFEVRSALDDYVKAR